MAIHSSILAWRISWREEPGGLWSMGLQRVGHDLVTSTFTFFLFDKFYSLATMSVCVFVVCEVHSSALQTRTQIHVSLLACKLKLLAL